MCAHQVGREWRWEVDQPEMLVKASIERHQQMIKELRGMPGVIPARMEEAMQVRCRNTGTMHD